VPGNKHYAFFFFCPVRAVTVLIIAPFPVCGTDPRLPTIRRVNRRAGPPKAGKPSNRRAGAISSSGNTRGIFLSIKPLSVFFDGYCCRLGTGQTFFLFRQKESLAKKIPQVCGTRLGCSTTRLSVASPEKKTRFAQTVFFRVHSYSYD
jgi:hypothetical protein